MITQLDNQSWSRELVTGSAEFTVVSVGSPPSETIWIVSNVRADGTFCILRSNPVPPDPGPGFSFTTVAIGNLGTSTIDFDPVVALDSSTGLLHIIGMQDDLLSTNPTLTNLVKFVYNTNFAGPFPQTLAAPVILVVASNIQSAYDISILTHGVGHKLVAAAISDPTGVITPGSPPPVYQPLFEVSVASIAIHTSTLTVTTSTVNKFNVGQLITFSGLTAATFLNGATVQATTIGPSQFTALYYYRSIAEPHTIPPITSPPGLYTITVNFAPTWESDVLVVYASNNIPLALVPSNPGPGQYTAAAGIYTFNIMDAAKAVLITYNRFYNSNGDTGTVVPVFSGQSLVAFELDTNDNCVANSLTVLVNSPERTGNIVDAVSIVTANDISEVYYQSHPQLITFRDLLFSFYVINHSKVGGNYVWDAAPTLLTSIIARWSDNRMTVIPDALGNRYFSQIYYTQTNHPEGLVGNALLGTRQVGSPPTWLFHVTPGSVAGGSIVQGNLVWSVSDGLSYVYLLEPFVPEPLAPNLPASYPFQAASVNTPTMSFTPVAGFYNQQNFTWLRGTKSVVDNLSLWAAVGEREVITSVSESWLIPSAAPYSLEVHNANVFWQDGGVTDGSGSISLIYTSVLPPPAKEQYSITPNGEYTFNAADASMNIIGLDLTSNIVTLTVNSNLRNFNTGLNVMLSGLTHSTYLNGVTLVITGLNITLNTFTASFSHANDPEHVETGTVGKPLSISYTYVSAVVPVYISNFDVPPTAQISPTSATVLRGQPLSLSASGSTDLSNDPMQYWFSDNDPDIVNVTLTPSGAWNTSPTTILNVAPTVGGAARTFNVGMAVEDQAGLHPPAAVTNIAINSNIITVTANTSMTPGETLMLYGINFAPTGSPSTLPVYVLTSVAKAVGGTTVYTGTITGGGANAFAGQTFFIQGFVSPFNDGAYLCTASSATTLTLANPNGTVEVAVSSASQSISYVNDRIYTVSVWTPTSFTATTTGSLTNLPSTVVTGWLMPQYQFAVTQITVPFNPAPTITFPTPPWSVAGSPPTVPTVSVSRNTTISITTGTISNPLTQFPMIITGNNDQDDATTYQWIQLSGTNVLPGAVQSGQTQIIVTTENLTVSTSGVNLTGETLVFQLTVNDGVNPPVSATCAVVVAAYVFAAPDTKQLSRSVWLEQDTITNVSMTSNVLTITANNAFAIGQQITLSSLVTATFLNGVTVVVTSLIGTPPLYTGFTATTVLVESNYTSAPDTGFATAFARISQRNTPQTWSAPSASVFYTNFTNVKRISITDGTDRYTMISPSSVTVYGVFGGVPPTLALLRKIFTPSNTVILDAVTTEDDTTYVLDNLGNLYRYSTAPLIYTDNPDTVIVLPSISSMTFTSLFATSSFANIRILAVSGPQGCLLLQLNNIAFTVSTSLALSMASNFLAGSNNVQFIRLSNVESLSSGEVLLGTVTRLTATVTAVSIQADILTVTCSNTFSLGNLIEFSGFTGSTAFLNGLIVPLISVTGSQFTAPLAFTGTFSASTAITSAATAMNAGSTYETLISLQRRQIIGTFNSSNLRNQYVNTGEIMFTPQSTYSGQPAPPVLGVPTLAAAGSISFTWTQERTDLVTGYVLQYAAQSAISFVLGVSTITATTIVSNVLTVTASNVFQPGQVITLTGTAEAFLNGQTMTVLTASPTQFTANFTAANYTNNSDTGSATTTKLTYAAPNFGQSILVVDTTTSTTLTQTAIPFPGVNQYTVDSFGNYTFNSGQSNHALAVTFRSPFATLTQIASGAILMVVVPLASGTYGFQMQATSNDGPSDFSNVQVFSL